MKLTSIHSIREFDEDRMLLHNSLDMLATNTYDSLMILVGDVERDGCGHLLLNQAETLLHRVIACSHDIDIEVVLVEAIEDDLNITCIMVRHWK